MTSTEQIRVLLVDDHPILLDGLVMLLECEPDIAVIGQASDGEEAIALFQQHLPDVLLIDLRLPTISGIEVIASIRADYPQVRVVVLSTYDTEEEIYQAVQAGAKGYVIKGSTSDELLKAVRTVYQNQSYIPPSVSEKLVRRMGAPTLSTREQEVLQLIAEGKTNLQISAELTIAASTVRFHVGHILDKLGVSDRTQAIVQAVNQGIVRL
ncbi:response regulator receiver domain protein [Synechococcus sp. PCC 7335]|uniref:response regulator n=1 Tax=Synechococcus sp. (strain ATCC 29403 / PCC 7335) TaxID=91464 RepID=UPI00017EBCCD|nr:response regulator transcription factor [Synechococcus sp. PCC 7335]EDX82966.1 response regulator receiver domain protein [Synechococcus sp. PCC 7335]